MVAIMLKIRLLMLALYLFAGRKKETSYEMNKQIQINLQKQLIYG